MDWIGRTTGVIFTIQSHNIVIKPEKSKGEKAFQELVEF